jgi:hypothetical protein
MNHPCLSCGACCAHFRVSFYWAEPVPEEFTEKISPHRSCMKGTNTTETPRCIALEGRLGDRVHCKIYGNRSTACREFEASYEKGEENQRCAAARLKHGLKPLSPSDWIGFSFKED